MTVKGAKGSQPGKLALMGGIKQPQRRAERRDGWTAARRALFLTTLADTANVAESARAAGMSGRSAYQRKRMDVHFAQAWGQALEVAYEELGTMLLRQAMFGSEQVEIVEDESGGIKSRKIKRETPLLLAHRLLTDHRAEVQRVRSERVDNSADTDAARAQLDAMLARLRQEEEGAA